MSSLDELVGGSLKHPDIKSRDVMRCYSDLWELELDLPGHRFDETSFNAGVPFWKADVYRQCYACKNAGKNYSRCQGSCGGKYIFCSVDCQRRAWKEHRRLHGCKKIVDKTSSTG